MKIVFQELFARFSPGLRLTLPGRCKAMAQLAEGFHVPCCTVMLELLVSMWISCPECLAPVLRMSAIPLPSRDS